MPLNLKDLIIIFVLSTIAFTSYSCNGGLDPYAIPGKAVFNGTIQFTKGGGAVNFPTRDSMFDFRVIAFKEIPRDRDSILILVSHGEAFYTVSLFDTLFPGVQKYSVVIPEKQFGVNTVTLKYVVVGQQYGPNFANDWKVVGLYSLIGNYEPSSVTLHSTEVQDDVDINVDFDNLPPQPFK